MPGELPAGDRLDDLPRVDELVRRGEQLVALQEEGPLLGVVEREALVGRHLPGVRLDLAEVRVHGCVDRRVRETEPHVHARRHIGLLADEPPVGGEGAVRGGRDERLDLGHDPPLHVAHSADGAALGEEPRTRPPHVGPRVLVPGPLHLALDVDPPRLRAGAWITQALERDPDLDHVAGAADDALRIELVVGVAVALVEPHEVAGAAGALGLDAVLLDAERVDREEERAAAVVERVEEDRDRVIPVEVVAVGDRGPDRLGLAVGGDDAEVDRLRRVPDQHFGLFLGRPAVHRLLLPEPAEPRGL